MEGTGYVDIFATKGIEYLLVIGFLIVLTVFWRVLSRSAVPGAVLAHAAAPGAGSWFRLAEGLFYHQGHTWAVPEQDQVVRVGLDDFAQRLIGVPRELDLPRVGTVLEQGERGMRLRVGAKAIDLLSPVGGEVLAVNPEVLRLPGLINDDPYGAGWLFKVRVPRLSANLKNLLSGGLARTWMEGTVAKLRSRMQTAELGPVMQDGGVPVVGIARELSPEQWEDIAAEFLMTR